MGCSHSETRVLSTNGFSREVSVAPYTESNPSAHGNITELAECTACGARRLENVNGRHLEVSPWRGSYASREAAAGIHMLMSQSERLERLAAVDDL
jgi:hypothetical protein